MENSTDPVLARFHLDPPEGACVPPETGCLERGARGEIRGASLSLTEVFDYLRGLHVGVRCAVDFSDVIVAL